MMTAAFFAAARPLFGGKMNQSQVNGLEALLSATAGLHLTHRAYLLATAHHETAKTMQPVRETLAGTDDKAIQILESSWARGRLPWVKTPYWRKDKDGKSWLGRGYVQLTHKANYQKASQLVGVDLVANPNAAMRANLAARILVEGCSAGLFTGKKLSDYLPGDYEGARRVVNGTDMAKEIARLAQGYEAALRALGAANAPSKPTPNPVPVYPPAPAPADAASATPGGLIVAALIAVALVAVFLLKG
ncbi:glycoside hydrolase family 19 protein [Paracoccus sp. SY]|uniref:glycoside hydrolase family 19 protein n=1 Tax=Paracoccus sp. SY TaxID=1330255 RepID=UPI0011AF9A7D|nr:glycoside hydrolase family 19 protein [Paracoccus sp. SY]